MKRGANHCTDSLGSKSYCKVRSERRPPPALHSTRLCHADHEGSWMPRTAFSGTKSLRFRLSLNFNCVLPLPVTGRIQNWITALGLPSTKSCRTSTSGIYQSFPQNMTALHVRRESGREEIEALCSLSSSGVLPFS